MEGCFGSRISDTPGRCGASRQNLCHQTFRGGAGEALGTSQQVPEHHGHQTVSAFIPDLCEAHVGQCSLQLSALHKVLWSSRGCVIQIQPRSSAALLGRCLPLFLECFVLPHVQHSPCTRKHVSHQAAQRAPAASQQLFQVSAFPLLKSPVKTQSCSVFEVCTNTHHCSSRGALQLQKQRHRLDI